MASTPVHAMTWAGCMRYMLIGSNTCWVVKRQSGGGAAPRDHLDWSKKSRL